jgi:hypothetical protein
MTAAIFIFLLGAQISTTPAGDVKIKMSAAGSPEYCLGSTLSYPLFKGVAEGPNDIRLRLRLKLWYVNNRTETNILPPQSRLFTRMTVSGQNDPTILRDARYSGVDLKMVLASSTARPAGKFTIYDYSILAGRASGTAPELVQCLSEKDPGCVSDQVMIPVLDRTSGLDLRGKTIQIMTTREHLLAPDAAQKLNDKWKQYGTIWSGSVDSEPVTLLIPDNPSPRDCRP